LCSFGAGKRKFCGKKVFQKIQHGGLNLFFIPVAILDFILQKFRLTNTNAIRRLKNVGYSHSYVKKTDFPPFWIEPPF
jgi:hypothetical protein